MEVKIISGIYKDCICSCFKLGIDWYFRDDELDCNVRLDNHYYELVK